MLDARQVTVACQTIFFHGSCVYMIRYKNHILEISYYVPFFFPVIDHLTMKQITDNLHMSVH